MGGWGWGYPPGGSKMGGYPPLKNEIFSFFAKSGNFWVAIFLKNP